MSVQIHIRPELERLLRLARNHIRVGAEGARSMCIVVIDDNGMAHIWADTNVHDQLHTVVALADELLNQIKNPQPPQAAPQP